jgi:hypothetical protein
MAAFKDLRLEVPIPAELSNIERGMLRQMAEPGQPLWKVLRKMVDYGAELKDAIVSADLTDPSELGGARKVQATIVAIEWVQQTFEAAMTDAEHEEEPHE